jgi:hypothetical protein
MSTLRERRARRRLPDLILEELDGTTWRLANGGKHIRLMIGIETVAVIPHRSRNPKTVLRIARDVRRHLSTKILSVAVSGAGTATERGAP